MKLRSSTAVRLSRHGSSWTSTFVSSSVLGTRVISQYATKPRSLADADPEVWKLIQKEDERQRGGLELIASEVKRKNIC